MFIRTCLATLYRFHYAVRYGVMRIRAYFYVEPAFRFRCVSVGRNLQVWNLPEVQGRPSIQIGEKVSIYGRLHICSPSDATDPRLEIGNRVEIGHQVRFEVTSRVIIEDSVNIAQRTRISDTDFLRARAVDEAADQTDTRICVGAWIGIGSVITRGVTVGQGAIIGSRSVVTSDIPPFSVAIGNPARVIVRDNRTRTGPKEE